MSERRKTHNGRDLSGHFRVKQVDVEDLKTDPDGVSFTDEMFEHVEILIASRDRLREFFALPVQTAVAVLDVHDYDVDVSPFAFSHERANRRRRHSGLGRMRPERVNFSSDCRGGRDRK